MLSRRPRPYYMGLEMLSRRPKLGGFFEAELNCTERSGAKSTAYLSGQGKVN